MADRGRLAFETPEELEERIEDYFESLRVFVDEVERTADGSTITRQVEVEQAPPTMAGLAHHLGVVRATIWQYSGRDDFKPVIARAKNRIAIYAETMLYRPDRTRGAQFALEVNHGYRDSGAPSGTGDGFEMKVIQPAESSDLKAIPRWSANDSEE